MAFRLVPTEQAASAQQAEYIVKDESGGACIPSGRTERVSNGWRVETYSTDGYASVPHGLSGRSRFTVVALNGEYVQLRDSVGYEFSVLRHTLECPIVKPGHILSAVQKCADQITDAVNESTGDRREFHGASEPELGWTPGIATGGNFEKR